MNTNKHNTILFYREKIYKNKNNRKDEGIHERKSREASLERGNVTLYNSQVSAGDVIG